MSGEMIKLVIGLLFIGHAHASSRSLRAFDETPRVGINNAVPGINLWEGGRIPWTLDGEFSESERKTLEGALMELEIRTGGVVRFPLRHVEEDYVRIIRGPGCSSYIGRQGGPQEMSLGPGCFWNDIVQHEFMHAMGFLHEHQRSDRDKYITVHWYNLRKGADTGFAKMDTHHDFGAPYDFESIMHADAFSTSKNGNPVITSQVWKGERFGNWVRATDYDVGKIVAMYTTGKWIPDR